MSAAHHQDPLEDLSYREALSAAALAYVRQGYAVIPLGRLTYDADGDKSFPRLINWQREPETLITQPAQVLGWFGPAGRARGIALAMGPSGLLMLDEDSYKEGVEEAAPPAGSWVERHVGRGGWHAYLRNPAGARNTQGALGKGIDTRGDGGLSICAPTRALHADGRMTQWQTERALSEFVSAHLPIAPETAVRASPQRLMVAGEITEVTPDQADAAVAKHRDAWLSSVKGQRHTVLRDYLRILARHELAKGTPVPELYELLEAATEEHPDARAGEYFASAPKLISSTPAYASATPWRLVENKAGFEGRFEAVPDEAPRPFDEAMFAFGADEFYDNPEPPPMAEWGAFGGETPLFYAEGVHWLQGESESGKTWIGLGVVAERLAAGDAVIVVDYEDTRANVVSRLRALGMTREAHRRLVYIDPAQVTFAELTEHLEVTDRQYALMLVDGVTSSLNAMGKSGRDEQEVTQWVDRLPRRARASICVDHVVKSVDDRRGMAIGSQAKKSVVTGTAWEVTALTHFGRGRSGVIRLTIQKDKPGGVRGRIGAKSVDIDIRSEDEGASVALAVRGAGFFDGDPDEALFSALFADGVDGGVTQRELQRLIRDRGASCGNNQRANRHKAWLEYYTQQFEEPQVSIGGPPPDHPLTSGFTGQRSTSGPPGPFSNKT